jgi:hypothetical protein
MTDPARHAQDRSWPESIARKIPGFRGYLEQEYRRESDHLLRQSLAEKLQGAKTQLDQLLRRLVDAVRLDDLPGYERVRGRLDGLINQLRSAERGYSAVFGFVRVREKELDQVYQVDMSLTDQVEAFVPRCTSPAPGQTASDHVTELIEKIDSLEKQFAQRAQILKGTN